MLVIIRMMFPKQQFVQRLFVMIFLGFIAHGLENQLEFVAESLVGLSMLFLFYDLLNQCQARMGLEFDLVQ